MIYEPFTEWLMQRLLITNLIGLITIHLFPIYHPCAVKYRSIHKKGSVCR